MAGFSLAERKKVVELGFPKSQERKEVHWKIKMEGIEEGEVEIAILSTRSGIHKKELQKIR